MQIVAALVLIALLTVVAVLEWRKHQRRYE